MATFLEELRKRSVFKIGAAYAIVGWLLIQIIVSIEEPLSLPNWTDTLVIVLVAAGFPLVLVLSWAYDITSHGLVRTIVSESADNDFPISRAVDRGGNHNHGGSLVVLPFENLSPDPDNAYFADGLTEELIADLSKVEALRVISRTSAMTLKGTRKDVATIARELNVRYVLEGSVRRAERELRITAQLIDALTDSHLWAEKYSGTVDDVFDLQEKLSRKIVAGLKLELTADEDRELAARPIPDVRAYEYYLRARGNSYSFVGTSIERAIRDLESALEILGDNVFLLRGLGIAYFQQLNAGVTEDPKIIERIEECARRVRNVDAGDAGSFLLTGIARLLRADWRSAVVSLREAYRRDDSDVDTLLFLGVTSLSTGLMDDAGRLLHRLHDVDPLSPLSVLLVGYHHFFGGRFEEAATTMKRALEIGPEVVVSRWAAVRIFMAAGEWTLAEENVDYLRRHDRTSPFYEAADLLLKASKEEVESLPEASPALRAWAMRDAEWAQSLSDAYALSGDRQRALAWLEIAIRVGFMNDEYLSRYDPFIAVLRDSPELREILDRVRRQRREFESTLPPIVRPKMERGLPRPA